MTTGTNPKPPADWRRWALAELDLRPGMSHDEARRILFTRLSEMDFMPPGGWDNALRVAGIAPCGGQLDGRLFVPAHRATEESLRAEVESFAARFFSLPPDLRATQFQELVKQSAGMPAVAARLEGLQPALELPSELPAGQSPEVTELFDQARRLFLLPRQERASRRLTFLKQCRMSLPQWQRAATIAQTKFARYAALEAALFRELATPSNREKQREKIARRRRRSVRKTRLSQTVVRATQKTPWWVGVAIGALLFIFRVMFSTNSSTYRSTPMPVAPRFDVQKANQEMNERVNKAIREGEPISEPIRRLYGLPPEKAPSRAPLTIPPSTPQTMPRGGQNGRIDQHRERMRDLMRRLDQPTRPDGSP